MSKSKRSVEPTPKRPELLAVMLEPHDDKSDQDVLDWLKRQKLEAEVLADRFISAHIPPTLLNAAEQIAHVSIKPLKQRR